jgi:uncharacterized membrane protein
MHVENWLIGPQLIGFIFVIMGFIQKRFPPKRINSLYGYRMPSAMKNQETWDEANSFSARYMIRLGLIMIVIGFALAGGLTLINMKEEARTGLSAALLVVSAMLIAVLLITGTEKHLSNTFDNKPL